MKKYVLACVAVAMLLSGSILAAGPNLLSYQGQVLTNTGAPIANGSYTAVFSFYPVSVGGILLWSESGSITTTAGLFTHTLGSITSIPAGLFATNSEVWLEVSVNGQIQIPRTQITSAGYSQSVNTVEGATGGTIIGNVGVTNVLTLGTPMSTNGALAMKSATTAVTTFQLYDYFGMGGAFDLLEESGNYYGGFEPDGNGTGGFLYVQNGSFGDAFVVDGNFSGGNPLIYMYGLSNVTFDLSTIANNSVLLPDSAISAPEILDEPGVVCNNSFSVVGLTTTMQDLITVTITIPAAGYIWLTGKIRQITLTGTTGYNVAIAQIDETAGGSFIDPHLSILGANSFPASPGTYTTLDCQRMYFKSSAGSYTFRLEAMQDFGSSGSSTAYYPTLTAMYFPTSYGSVATMVSSDEAGGFESAKMVSIPSGTVPSTRMAQSEMYSVDLRELELKVAKAEAEAQKARAALAEAKLNEQRNHNNSSINDQKK